jgi:hypothetical protein
MPRENKELCKRIQTFCKENLAELGCEMLCDYLHNKVKPKLVFEKTQIQKDWEGYIDAMKQYPSSFRLTKICPSTCSFNYCGQKKGCFVDGHKKAATITVLSPQFLSQ